MTFDAPARNWVAAQPDAATNETRTTERTENFIWESFAAGDENGERTGRAATQRGLVALYSVQLCLHRKFFANSLCALDVVDGVAVAVMATATDRREIRYILDR